MKARRLLLTLLFCLFLLPAVNVSADGGEPIVIEENNTEYSGYMAIFCRISCLPELGACTTNVQNCDAAFYACVQQCMSQ